MLTSGVEFVSRVGQANLPPDSTKQEILLDNLAPIGVPDLAFGNTVAGSIHGFKFEDVDGNGLYNAAIDLPLVGVVFTLTGTDGLGNEVNTSQTTGTNGEFWFTGLLPSVDGDGPATGYTGHRDGTSRLCGYHADHVSDRSTERPGTGGLRRSGDDSGGRSSDGSVGGY